MYAVAVKDHFMIAHSLRGRIFGPAQQLHGATYNVTAEFRIATLDDNGVVIDIGLALKTLKEVLSDLNFKNLDDVEKFHGKNTTTEFLAGHIHSKLSERIAPFFKGSLKVKLEESHVAWASFEGPISTA